MTSPLCDQSTPPPPTTAQLNKSMSENSCQDLNYGLGTKSLISPRPFNEVEFSIEQQQITAQRFINKFYIYKSFTDLHFE